MYKVLDGCVFFWVFVCCISGVAESQELKEDKLQILADKCDSILQSSIVDFYLPHCIDFKNGGYLESVDGDGKFCESEYKFLTLQTRQMWFFSMLAEKGIRKEESLAAARSGFDFLQTHFLDREHGGYYSRVKMDGGEFDTRKHIYLNAFAIFGLAAYYRAAGDESALDAALELFDVFEEKAYDRVNGGYKEFFYRDWKFITDPNEPRFVGEPNTKTYNTHLHILEAFTELYRVAPSDRLRSRIAELILINVSTVKHPEFPCNIDGWTNDWTMLLRESNLRASYGHDVECAWLVLDAARAIGQSVQTLENWAVATVDHSIARGFDEEHGGFFYSGPVGKKADDTKKEWWVQAEALVSMLEMFKLTGDRKYFDIFLACLEFVEKHQIAMDEHGGWWATRNGDGSSNENSSRTSTWHGAYHNGRAMVRCKEILLEFESVQKSD